MPGPRPGARCSVCNHPQQAVIDDLLLAGERSFASLARTFAVGEKALSRHLALHVAKPVSYNPPRGRTADRVATSAPEVPESLPEPSDAATVDPADVLRRQLAWLDSQPLEGLSPSQRVDLLESRRRTADSLSRLNPPSQDVVVTVNDVVGLPQLFAKLHEALKEWPGARERLAEIWRESRGEKLAVEEV